MNIFQALTIGVSGLQSQSNVINVVSDNIANVNTVGYKRAHAGFQTLVQNSNSPYGYSAGGATPLSRRANSAQGEILSGIQVTDMAISGNGFFAVRQGVPDTGELAYTRAGAFAPNADGDFINGAGFFLQGWRLDDNGALDPALVGGIASAAAIASLVPINVQNATQDAIPTSSITFKANLKSSQTIYAGTPAYDPDDDLANMSAGVVNSHYNTNIEVVDSEGVTHSLIAAFLKTDVNTWAVELYVDPASDIVAANAQIANGTVTFNGDGTLASVSASLTSALPIAWTGGASNQITFNWGTAGIIDVGLNDGLQQINLAYSRAISQDGLVSGLLNGVNITEDGTVVGLFNNGTTRGLFKIPLATFVDANQLQSATGNIFLPGINSSDATYFQANEGPAGKIFSGALERSNTEVDDQLTIMIIAQRAYQSNAKTVSIADEILKDLTRIVS